MQIKWLKKALNNLDHEATYLAQRNPKAAAHAVKRISQAVLYLADNPQMGRVGRVFNTRELVITNTPYVVLYRVNQQQTTVEILRIFHSARKMADI